MRGAATPVASRAPLGAVAVRLLLAAIVAGAFVLRVIGADWGEPYAYHFDEPFVVKPALRMVAEEDPNPRFFRYPSLMLYAEAAIVALNRALWGMPLEVPRGPAYGPSDLLPETWPALAGGRYLVAFFGAVGVLAVGLLAWTTGGPAAAIIAAGLLAVFPLHVEHSHYLTTDVPMASFVAIAFVALAGIRRPLLAAAVSGVATGLAVATKYTAAASVPVLALVCLLAAGTPALRLGRVAVLAVACTAAFVAACPYAVLDAGSFLAELRIVRDHYRGAHLGAQGAGNWAWYIERLRADGLGAAGLWLVGVGALGTVLDFARARRPLESDGPGAQRPCALGGAAVALISLGYAAAWLGYLGAVTVRFERNLMPAVVFACAGAGHGLASLLRAADALGRPAGMLGAAALVLLLLGPTGKSLAVVRRLAGDDTRNLAGAWIAEHVPAGARIVREEYTPQLDPARYEVEYLWSLTFRDPADYEGSGVNVLVASQAVFGRFLTGMGRAQHPDLAERYDRLFARPATASFGPGASVNGPVIHVYRLDAARSPQPR